MSLSTHCEITIVIPYYKGLKYLELAIESVLKQTRPTWNLVVVDDCGGDDAEASVKSYSDNRISYHRNEKNLGLATNWNRSVTYSHSPYTTILHADDQLEPTYVEEMVALMNRYPGVVAANARANILDHEGRVINPVANRVKKFISPRHDEFALIRGDNGLASLMIGDWIICPTLCYRTNYLKEHPFETRYKFVVDLSWITEVLFDGQTIISSNRILYNYRVHVGTQTSVLTANSLRFKEELALTSLVYERCKTRAWKKSTRNAKLMPTVRLHLLYLILQSVRLLDFPKAWQMGKLAVSRIPLLDKHAEL